MSQIQITSSSIAVLTGPHSGSVFLNSVAPQRDTPYYRLAYSGSYSQQPIYSSGVTRTTMNLSCWDSFPEIQTFASGSGMKTMLVDPQANN